VPDTAAVFATAELSPTLIEARQRVRAEAIVVHPGPTGHDDRLRPDD
jgi:hypothetical protein